MHLERAIARAVEHAWTRACARNAALEGGESESATVMTRLGALEHERARVRGRALATCAAPAHHAAGAQVAESARERGTARLPERLRCTQIAALGRWSPEAMRTLGRVPAWLARAGLEDLDDNDAARGETAWIAAAHARAADEHGLAHEGAGEPTQAQALARACAAWRWTQSDPPLLALARWLRAGRTAPEDDETWAGIVQEEAALRAPGALPAHNAAARRSDEASAEIIERARDAYREGGWIEEVVARHAASEVKREAAAQGTLIGTEGAMRRLEAHERAAGAAPGRATLVARRGGREIGWRVACDTPTRALAARGAGAQGTPNGEEAMIIGIGVDGPETIREIVRA